MYVRHTWHAGRRHYNHPTPASSSARSSTTNIYTKTELPLYASTASVFKNGQRLCGNWFGNSTGCSRGCLRCGLLSSGVEDLLDVLHQRLHLRLFVGLAGDFDVSQLPEIEVPVTFVRDSKFCKDKKKSTIG